MIQTPKLVIVENAKEYLYEYADQSYDASIRVGTLLQKAQHFDRYGVEDCNAQTEIRLVGQRQILPVRSGTLYAFVELTNSHKNGEIFLVAEVAYLGELRRVWQRVYDHLGYDSSLDTRAVFRV